MSKRIEVNVFSEIEPQEKQAEALIVKAAEAAYAMFQYPFGASVDVTLTDDENIAEINAEYRDVSAATDVLSFPLNDFYEGEAGEDIETGLDLDTGLLPLGDIIISVERARAQGEEYGHGFERECAYLAVHSMLHLLGYDHMDEGEEKARMREMEEKIMAKLGLERE